MPRYVSAVHVESELMPTKLHNKSGSITPRSWVDRRQIVVAFGLDSSSSANTTTAHTLKTVWKGNKKTHHEIAVKTKVSHHARSTDSGYPFFLLPPPCPEACRTQSKPFPPVFLL